MSGRTRVLLVLAVWLATAGGIGGIAWAMRVPFGAALPPLDPVSSRARDPNRRVLAFDSAVVLHDGFRGARRPAPSPFDPLGSQAPPPAVEPRPQFVLVGLTLGHARAALVRGIPGYDGAQVIGEGEEFAGLRISRIDSAGALLVWRGESVRVQLTREGT